MKNTTATVLERVINDQCGFLTDTDLGLLMRDSDMHPVNVLIRRHTGRGLVRLDQVEAATRAAGDDLRDVSFPVPEYRDLKSTLRHHQRRANA